MKKERKHRLSSGTGRAAERKNTLRTGRFFFVTVILACFMLTLTSCVKSETAMEIGRDRKFTLSATYLYADEIMTYMQEDPFENIRISFRDSGYQVEDFKEEGYTGIRLSYAAANIDTVSSDAEVSVDLFSLLSQGNAGTPCFFKKEKGFFRDRFTADFYYDFAAQDMGADSPDIDMAALAGKSFLVSYKVTLPGKPLSDNASERSADGRTLSWKVPYGEKTEIRYSFTLLNAGNLMVILGLALLVFILLMIILILMLVTKNRRERERAEENAQIEEERTLDGEENVFIEEESMLDGEENVSIEEDRTLAEEESEHNEEGLPIEEKGRL